MEFSFYSSLADQDPSINAKALQAYGFAMAAWARLETHLDALTIHINKPSHDTTLYEGPHPVSFEKKIAVLKRWFNNFQPLSSHKDDMRELTSRLKMLSKEHRNVYFHAIPASYDASKDTIEFHHIRLDRENNLRARHIVVPLASLAAFAELTNMCNDYLSRITQQVFTVDWPAQPKTLV